MHLRKRAGPNIELTSNLKGNAAQGRTLSPPILPNARGLGRAFPRAIGFWKDRCARGSGQKLYSALHCGALG